MKRQEDIRAADLGQTMVSFVRAFGLHRPAETPCGEAIPVAEAHALMDLSARGPMSHQSLATSLRLEKSTVSRLARQMEKRGWIERYGARGDGRVVLIRLSRKGQRAAGRLEKARRMKFETLLAAIPENKRAHTLAALEILRKALD